MLWFADNGVADPDQARAMMLESKIDVVVNNIIIGGLPDWNVDLFLGDGAAWADGGGIGGMRDAGVVLMTHIMRVGLHMPVETETTMTYRGGGRLVAKEARDERRRMHSPHTGEGGSRTRPRTGETEERYGEERHGEERRGGEDVAGIGQLEEYLRHTHAMDGRFLAAKITCKQEMISVLFRGYDPVTKERVANGTVSLPLSHTTSVILCISNTVSLPVSSHLSSVILYISPVSFHFSFLFHLV